MRWEGLCIKIAKNWPVTALKWLLNSLFRIQLLLNITSRQSCCGKLQGNLGFKEKKLFCLLQAKIWFMICRKFMYSYYHKNKSKSQTWIWRHFLSYISAVISFNADLEWLLWQLNTTQNIGVVTNLCTPLYTWMRYQMYEFHPVTRIFCGMNVMTTCY